MTASLLRLILLSLLASLCHSQSGVFEDPFGQLQGNQTDVTNSPTVTATVITATPTTSPTPGTKAPSVAPLSTASVAGVVSLKLVNTPSLLIGQLEIDFLNAVTTFLRQRSQAGLDERSTLELTQIGIQRQFRASDRRSLMSHHRDLQDVEPLYVDVQVAAQHSRSSGAGDLDLDSLLSLLFTNFGEEFLAILQDQSNDSFFNTVEAVEVVVETIPPTTNPVKETSPPVLEDGDVRGDGDDEDEIWSIGVIVGIAAAGAVAILLLVAIICRLTSSKKDVPAYSKSPAQRDWDTPTGPQVFDSRTKRPGMKVNDPRQPEQNLERQSLSLPLQAQPSDLESNGLYSYSKAESDSTIGGSVMQNSIYGHDDMSYAYSLQAGIEPSVAPSDSRDPSPMRQNDSMVPKEIPHISVPQPKGQPRVSDLEDSLAADRTMEEFSHEVQLSSSDLHLTESDLALLPSNLRDSFEEKSRSTATPPIKTRVVLAPSGKLGIVIDTTIDGPVVHHVNNASALKGKIFPGDLIVAIDNVDTRAMSASAITGLMIKTAKQKRRLTVLGAQEIPTKKSNGKSGSNKRS